MKKPLMAASSDSKAYGVCQVCKVTPIRRTRIRCQRCKVLAGKPPLDTTVYVIDGEPCMRIPLTQGKYALVDERNYERLMTFNWSAHFTPNTGTYYPLRAVSDGKRRQKRICMAQEVMCPGADHRNRDTLDNRKSNLRPATAQQNACNRGLRSDNNSGFKGVSPKGDRFVARITRHGRTIHLGYYQTAEQAADAYDRAAPEIHGEFARPNFRSQVAA